MYDQIDPIPSWQLRSLVFPRRRLKRMLSIVYLPLAIRGAPHGKEKI